MKQQDETEKVLSFTIYGEPASKANSRRLVTIRGRPAFIKSQKALNYLNGFSSQCPQLPELMGGDLEIFLTIYYASRRPDLDESVVLDALQGRVYTNDRQIKVKHVVWGLDRVNPRTEIRIKQVAEADSGPDAPLGMEKGVGHGAKRPRRKKQKA